MTKADTIQVKSPPTSNHTATHVSHAVKNSNKGIYLIITLIVLIAIALVIGISNKASAPAITTNFKVSISSTGFFPKTINIKPNQTITWTNTDSSPHWIQADPYPTGESLPALNSGGALNTNDTYSYTFNKPGSYSYHDKLNPYNNQATVVVK